MCPLVYFSAKIEIGISLLTKVISKVLIVLFTFLECINNGLAVSLAFPCISLAIEPNFLHRYIDNFK